MPGIIAGGRIEAGWSANSAGSRDVDQEDKEPALSYRHSYMYMSGAFGRVTLGWTNPAGRSAMFGSHNGAWAGTEYSVDHTSSISVMTTDNEVSGYSIWDFMPSINWGRANVLRYNSPSIGPVTFAASLQKDGDDPTDQMWAFEGRLSQGRRCCQYDRACRHRRRRVGDIRRSEVRQRYEHQCRLGHG